MPPVDDTAIFELRLDALLDGVRAAGSEGTVDALVAAMLERTSVLRDGALTESGRALYRTAWVLRRRPDAERMMGQAIRVLTPLQVIDQELKGLGPVPEAGVLDLLRQHGAAPVGATVDSLRGTFRWLSSIGVVAYSLKTKTVRSLAAAPEVALAGEIQTMAAMISPKSPYLNIVRLRRILRRLEGVVWWADPHFGARALEELAEELDFSRVTAVRILSGDAENVASPRSHSDYRRFRDEMTSRGLSVEWRVDPKSSRDWHDRWISADKETWNVPPINTLLKNDYSEIVPASDTPPLVEWWERSTPR